MSKKPPRTRNKQEMDSFSGTKKKRQVKYEQKIKIHFEFVTEDGNLHKPPDARLKIAADGGVSCLIKEDDKWKSVKAKLKVLKVRYEERLLAPQRRVYRKPTR